MRIMAILNCTPDSFSDGGAYTGAPAAIAAAHAMIAAGAHIIDVGAESTRPGATRVPPAQELERLLPVVGPLVRAGIRVSVDTRNAATMRACLDLGVRMINDVSALRHDPAAAKLVADARCEVILMHMRGTPADMHLHAHYADVVAEVRAELASRIAAAERACIGRDRILIDPGLGFAKTAAHNIALLAGLPALAALGCPLVVGASRKRFLGGDGPADRLGGSIACALIAAAAGAAILRVHDVAETAQALALARAVGAQSAGQGAGAHWPVTPPPVYSTALHAERSDE